LIKGKLAFVGPGLVLIDTLLLFGVGFRYTGFGPPSEGYVIFSGFVLSFLAFAFSAIVGRWWFRVVWAFLAVLCLLGWYLVMLGWGI